MLEAFFGLSSDSSQSVHPSLMRTRVEVSSHCHDLLHLKQYPLSERGESVRHLLSSLLVEIASFPHLCIICLMKVYSIWRLLFDLAA